MARRKSNTQFASNQASDITRGLATMESHWKAQDGEIEECSAALWDSWPVQEALKEHPNDPEAVLATLAGRMFLAGSESTDLNVLPQKSASGTPAASVGTVTLQAANMLLSHPTPMQQVTGTEFLDDEITSSVIRGLARMEDHREAEDFQIEEYSKDLLNAWPVEEALDQLCEIAPSLRKFIVPDEEAVLGDIDPRYVLGVLAGRIFLAGLEAARQQGGAA